MSTATMSIAEELFAAAATVSVIPQTGRRRDDILRDLTKALEVTSDDTFSRLSDPARAWYNASVEAVNSGANVPKLPGYDDLKSGQTLPTTGGSEVVEEQLVDASPVAEEAAEEKVVTSAPSTPAPAVYLSATELCRQIVIEHMDWSEAQVKEALIAVAPSHNIPTSKVTDNLVWTGRNYTRQAIQTAIKLGWRPPDK